MLVTGVLGSTKSPVVPEYVIAMFTVILIFSVLNIVFAWGDCSRFFCWMVCFQNLCLGFNGIVVGIMGGASLSTDESSVSIDVSVVLSSK